MENTKYKSVGFGKVLAYVFVVLALLLSAILCKRAFIDNQGLIKDDNFLAYASIAVFVFVLLSVINTAPVTYHKGTWSFKLRRFDYPDFKEEYLEKIDVQPERKDSSEMMLVMTFGGKRGRAMQIYRTHTDIHILAADLIQAYPEKCTREFSKWLQNNTV